MLRLAARLLLALRTPLVPLGQRSPWLLGCSESSSLNMMRDVAQRPPHCSAPCMHWTPRPYIALSVTESRRVAEQLSQLPRDVDVEGMVEASWRAVQREALDRGGCAAVAVVVVVLLGGAQCLRSGHGQRRVKRGQGGGATRWAVWCASVGVLGTAPWPQRFFCVAGWWAVRCRQHAPSHGMLGA